jgi:hypothetical protein
MTAPANAGGINNIYFADLDTSITGGQAQWDYIRWTNAGQFELPEPTGCLALALGGGMLLLGRRRRAS